MNRFVPFLSCLVMGSWLTLSAAAIQDRDVLITKEGKQWPVIVVSEKVDRVYYKSHPDAPNTQDMRWSGVADIQYNGMDAGLYKAGTDALATGDYQVAAEWFNRLVNGATREWEQSYGLLRRGESYELAQDWKQAAESFAQFTEVLPEHRWYGDMMYRQGVNLALSGDSAGAEKIAKALEARFKDPEIRDRGSQQRALAVRTAATALGGNMSEAKSLSRKITLSERDGTTYYHWTEFWAGLLMQEEEFGEAASVYERVLEQAQGDPARAAALALGLGIALAQDNEPDQALAVLARLDALPYGSAKQRLEARYWIGKLMWETASKRAESDREGVVEFAKQQLKDARQTLQAVVDSVVAHPVKDKAKALLDQMPAPE